MGRNRRTPTRKRRKSRSYSSDSRRSYSRSRSPSTSEPSRGALRQPPQLRGSGAVDESRPHVSNAQLTERNARITALESELAQSRKANEELQKQFNESSRKLKKAEAAQATYEKWLEALVGVSDRVVNDQTTLREGREALQKLETKSYQGTEDLALFVKETSSFLEEQAEKNKIKKVQTPQEGQKEAVDQLAQEKAQIHPEPTENATESQSVFRPGLKFKFNPQP